MTQEPPVRNPRVREMKVEGGVDTKSVSTEVY
jgi:hypothetical protein